MIKKYGLAFIGLVVGLSLSPFLTCGTSQNGSLFLNADSNQPKSPAQISAISLETAFQEVFDKVSPSVVSIATEKTVNVNVHPFGDPFFEQFFGRRSNPGKVMKQKQTGLGSGIILNDDGYIMTNHHVVKDMDKLTVKLKNQKTYDAEVIGSDELIDIALLKIKAPKGSLQPVTLGDSEKVRVGNWAIAIGAPLGFEQSFTVGVVSAIQRGGLDSSGTSYIQTDTAINQGNSGGPLLNIMGEVIGINRMIVTPSGGSIGIGLSIPINEARKIAEELKEKGRISRPWLGIGLDPISEEDMEEFGLKTNKGAIIHQIMKGSPAERAGLQLYDIIIEIDGKQVSAPEDVINYVRSSKIGKKIDLKLNRKKSEMSVSITPREKPN
jgi:serine protease Do